MPKPINGCSTLRPAPMWRKASVRGWRMPKKESSGRRGSFSASSKRCMAFLVRVTARAERDLANLYGEIDAEHSDAALKWYRGLKKAVVSLEDYPNRGSLMRGKHDLR